LGLFSKVEPIFTALFSIWFLGEILQWHPYVGILTTIASLEIYQVFEHRQRPVLDTPHD